MPPKKRTRVGADKIQEAVNEVIEKGTSIRSAATTYNVAKSHLQRLVIRAKASTSTSSSFVYEPNIGNKKVFTTDQERSLADYLKTSAKMCYGLTTKQVRELAYQFAVRLAINMPVSWKQNKIASLDWLKGFLKRHDSLAVRKPENTSLARTTSFNKTNVKDFFDNLARCYKKHCFPPNMIWNLDETGCTTVTSTPKIVAESGIKRVGQVSSAERGTLVTMLAFINAAGGNIPPVFIFPRVHFKEHMLENGPPGALGLANPSGWITEDCFLNALEHFVQFVKPTVESPALILLDNHKTHITINIVLYAREHNLIVLTFPPHCSHRLQPLDVTVYGPFKARYRASMNDWMTSNPGKTVTIFNVAQFAKDAFYAAFNMNNVTSGFKNTGIWPINQNIFADEDFLPSFATDRPQPLQVATCSENLIDDCIQDESTSNVEKPQPGSNAEELQKESGNKTEPQRGPPSNSLQLNPSISTERLPELSISNVSLPGRSDSNSPQAEPSTADVTHYETSNSPQLPITPEQIRPYPKAPLRKSTAKKRKGKTTIITETPEKDRLLLESMMDILKKETPKACKEKLSHVKQVLKDKACDKGKKNVQDKKQSTTKNNGSRGSRKRKSAAKFAIYSSSDSTDSLPGSNSDSIDDTGSQKYRFGRQSKNRSGNDENCNVCNKKYSDSTEDWYKCKICVNWVHESCGVKGLFNFFCSLCH